MFNKTPTKKLEKIIKKAIKIVNREFYNDRRTLGRYVIRDCFHLVQKTKEEVFLVSYCFECIDKATGYKQFYGFGSTPFENDITVEKLSRQLRNILQEFIAKPLPKQFKEKEIERIDYRRVKID